MDRSRSLCLLDLRADATMEAEYAYLMYLEETYADILPRAPSFLPPDHAVQMASHAIDKILHNTPGESIWDTMMPFACRDGRMYYNTACGCKEWP